MEKIIKRINDWIEADCDYVIGLRRYFHQYPELSAQEYNTAKKIEEELDKLGLSHERVGETGVFTQIKGNLKGDKTVVLRADTDALSIVEDNQTPYKSKNEGVMHACGHDAHTASLLGAVRFLANNPDLFGGTVKVTFQQGEEIGYGAKIFIENGYLDGAQRTFGIHTDPKVPVGSVVLMEGPNNASVDWFKISIKGKSAHVSTPEQGVDAVYVASQIVIGAQALVTRRTSPMDNVLIGIGKINGGTAYNIVAENAEIEGTLRALTVENRRQVKSELEELAKVTAKIYGATAVVEWKDFTSPLINDTTATKEARQIATELFGEDKIITARKPALGGDDFAEYILKVPGVYAYVGSGNPQKPCTVVSAHNSYFDVDEECLAVASKLYSAYALFVLNS